MTTDKSPIGPEVTAYAQTIHRKKGIWAFLYTTNLMNRDWTQAKKMYKKRLKSRKLQYHFHGTHTQTIWTDPGIDVMNQTFAKLLLIKISFFRQIPNYVWIKLWKISSFLGLIPMRIYCHSPSQAVTLTQSQLILIWIWKRCPLVKKGLFDLTWRLGC